MQRVSIFVHCNLYRIESHFRTPRLWCSIDLYYSCDDMRSVWRPLGTLYVIKRLESGSLVDLHSEIQHLLPFCRLFFILYFLSFPSSSENINKGIPFITLCMVVVNSTAVVECLNFSCDKITPFLFSTANYHFIDHAVNYLLF